MNHKIIRTDSNNLDFQNLVFQLNQYLAGINGESHSFYMQYNNIDILKNVIVVYNNNYPVACGAIKEYSIDKMEVKRMWVQVNFRKKGYATLVLNELEIWAKELGYKYCILETGITMIDAISLYKKNCYLVVDNYGQYESVKSSICFQKEL